MSTAHCDVTGSAGRSKPDLTRFTCVLRKIHGDAVATFLFFYLPGALTYRIACIYSTMFEMKGIFYVSSGCVGTENMAQSISIKEYRLFCTHKKEGEK